ncbi:MAG: hypothetical protein ACFFDI_20170, partial [Promethearchaeota archaeon]
MDKKCNECPNPLVEVKPSRIEGLDEDIPFFEDEDDFGMMREVADNVRGFSYLEFRERNPCADTYFIFKGKMDTVRIGIKKGNANYVVESDIAITQAKDSEQTIVRHTGKDNNKHYDSEGIPIDLVPLLGRIYFVHKLIALKNNEIYDQGSSHADCVPEPPEGEGYFCPIEPAIIDGKQYDPAQGLLPVSTLPSTPKWWKFNREKVTLQDISGVGIHFEKGDIGVTIRKKETPTSCSIPIENLFPESSLFYKLKIENITNCFNEPLPDNVRIALKVDVGKIEGEEEIDGWQIFNTSGGSLEWTFISYFPPDCTEENYPSVANLSIAPVCEWHDGDPTIGNPRISKEIPLPECGKWVGTVTYRNEFHKIENKNYEASGKYWETHLNHHSNIQVTIPLNLKESPFVGSKSRPRVLTSLFGQSYSQKLAGMGSYNLTLNRNYTEKSRSKKGRTTERNESEIANCNGHLSRSPRFMQSVSLHPSNKDQSYKFYLSFAIERGCKRTSTYK